MTDEDDGGAMTRLQYTIDEGLQYAGVDRNVAICAALRIGHALDADPEAQKLLEKLLDWHYSQHGAHGAPAYLSPTYRPAVDDRGS